MIKQKCTTILGPQDCTALWKDWNNEKHEWPWHPGIVLPQSDLVHHVLVPDDVVAGAVVAVAGFAEHLDSRPSCCGRCGGGGCRSCGGGFGSYNDLTIGLVFLKSEKSTFCKFPTGSRVMSLYVSMDYTRYFITTYFNNLHIQYSRPGRKMLDNLCQWLFLLNSLFQGAGWIIDTVLYTV